MLLDPYILSLPQVLVDYVFAFGALGVSGFFSKRKNGLIIGYVAAVIGRFIFAVLSGVIFFGTYAPEGMSPLAYSVAYNGSYLAAEAALTIVVLLIPAVRNGIARICLMARE
jgi:thiamine transporter